MAEYGPRLRSVEERFWPKVDKTDACWNWTANKNNKGYGMIWDLQLNKKVLAHRTSWELVHGSVPFGQCVLHKCDNPGCVNPEHLFLGTVRDNAIDMMSKGRGRYVAHHGESNGFSKLTWEKVREIRRLKQVFSASELAVMFGTCESNIGHVLSYRSWQDAAAANAA